MGNCCKSASVTDNPKADDEKQYNNALRLVIDKDIGGFLQNGDIDTIDFEISLDEMKVNPKEKSMDVIVEEFSQLDGVKQYDLFMKAAKQVYGESVAKQADIIKQRINKIDMGEEKIDNNVISITQYVINELQKAIDNNQNVKAAGADRAFTAIVDPAPNGILLKLTELGYRNPNCNDLITENLSLLTTDAQQKIERKNMSLIEAGCYVRDIENYYWPPDNPNADPDPKKEYWSLHRSNLYDSNGNIYHCLPNRGGFEYLSYVGLSSVGAMGFSATNYDKKGANIGDIASAILSLRLLTVQNGIINHYQIEPTNGIHNSDAAEKLKSQNPSVILIQDDQIFSDVVTSMGTYGVITHCYIELADAYWLVIKKQIVEFTIKNQQPWIDAYNKVANDPNVWQFEAYFQPYHDRVLLIKQQKCRMLISSWEKPKLENIDPETFKPNTREEIIKYGGAGTNIDDFPTSTVLLAAHVTQLLSNSISKYKIGVAGLIFALNVALKEDLISENTDPNTGKKVDTLTMSCIEALDLGTPNLIPTNTSGNSFNMSQSVNATQDYMSYLNQQLNDNHLAITSPLATRFSAKSYGSVACAGEYDTAWIEQPMLTVGKDDSMTKGSYDTAYNNSVTLLTNTLNWFLSQYKGKIHWGEWFDETNPLGYEKWWQNILQSNKDSFFANYKKFNSDKVFSNTFTANSGMDV
eukprot:471669_1